MINGHFQIVTTNKMKINNTPSYKDFIRDKNNNLVHKSLLNNNNNKKSYRNGVTQ